MGCAESHEQAGVDIGDASIEDLPDVFIGSWEDAHCRFRLASSGIEWRGPDAATEPKLIPVSVFTMDWHTEPANDSVTPLSQTWGEGKQPWILHEELPLPMPTEEMLVFKTSRLCVGGEEETSCWWLRPHTEYIERHGAWTVLETLTGSAYCADRTIVQRLVRTEHLVQAATPRGGAPHRLQQGARVPLIKQTPRQKEATNEEKVHMHNA